MNRPGHLSSNCKTAVVGSEENSPHSTPLPKRVPDGQADSGTTKLECGSSASYVKDDKLNRQLNVLCRVTKPDEMRGISTANDQDGMTCDTGTKDNHEETSTVVGSLNTDNRLNLMDTSSRSSKTEEVVLSITRKSTTLVNEKEVCQNFEFAHQSNECADGDNDIASVKKAEIEKDDRKMEPAVQKPPVQIRYFTDQGFRPLLCAFRNLNWKDFGNKGRWNIFWGNVANVRALYQPGQRHYFTDDQLVNHFPSCYQISRKDNMTKNIKKFRTEMHHAKDPIGRKNKYGDFLYLDLIAPTYLLPFDFNNFVEEFKKHGGLWIVKPCNGCQGQGIFLVNQLEQARRWQEKALAEVAVSVQESEAYQGYLVSRYVANPLLIDGKKFDLRIYVLVTSFKPLRCYFYRQGFCRFCAIRYSPNPANIDNKFMHLTNVAIQKLKKGYNRTHGNKWSVNIFRLYMERVYGRERTDALFDQIFWMIVQSLRAVQPLMDNERHCFEMYGYDCLVDAHLKPWLLEINASPSLEDTTPVDRINKSNLLMDTMKMAIYERCPQFIGITEKKMDGSDMPLGDFEILYLEEPLPKIMPAEKQKKIMGRYGPSYGSTLVPAQSGTGVEEKPRWKI